MSDSHDNEAGYSYFSIQVETQTAAHEVAHKIQQRLNLFLHQHRDFLPVQDYTSTKYAVKLSADESIDELHEEETRKRDTMRENRPKTDPPPEHPSDSPPK